MWLIAGLGNPGAQYELTRHNVGFLVVDALARVWKMDSFKAGFSGLYSKHSWNNTPVLLLKSQTFMNRSGRSIQEAAAFFKIPLEQILVVHDDLDLSLGALRLKKGGSDGGHNGLKDTTRLMGPDYLRVRVGIGRPAHKDQVSDYVLSAFRDLELKTLEPVLSLSILAIETIILHGLEKAQAIAQK